MKNDSNPRMKIKKRKSIDDKDNSIIEHISNSSESMTNETVPNELKNKMQKTTEKKSEIKLSLDHANNFKNFINEDGSKNYEIIVRGDSTEKFSFHVMPLGYSKSEQKNAKFLPSGVKMMTTILQVLYENSSGEGNITEGRDTTFEIVAPNNKFTMTFSDTKIDESAVEFVASQTDIKDLKQDISHFFDVIQVICQDIKNAWWNAELNDKKFNKYKIEKKVRDEILRLGKNCNHDKIRQEVIEREKEIFMENSKTGISCVVKTPEDNHPERLFVANSFCYRNIYDNEKKMLDEWKKVITEKGLQNDSRFRFLDGQKPRIYSGFQVLALDDKTNILKSLNPHPSKFCEPPASNILKIEKQPNIIRPGALVVFNIKFSTYNKPFRGIRVIFDTLILYKNGLEKGQKNIINPFPNIKPRPIQELLPHKFNKDTREDENAGEYNNPHKNHVLNKKEKNYGKEEFMGNITQKTDIGEGGNEKYDNVNRGEEEEDDYANREEKEEEDAYANGGEEIDIDNNIVDN